MHEWLTDYPLGWMGRKMIYGLIDRLVTWLNCWNFKYLQITRTKIISKNGKYYNSTNVLIDDDDDDGDDSNGYEDDDGQIVCWFSLLRLKQSVTKVWELVKCFCCMNTFSRIPYIKAGLLHNYDCLLDQLISLPILL